MPYKKIIAANPAAAYLDQIAYYGATVYYNGIPTVQQKTALAQEQSSGVMFWLLEHDTLDETSLLNAIYETVKLGP